MTSSLRAVLDQQLYIAQGVEAHSKLPLDGEIRRFMPPQTTHQAALRGIFGPPNLASALPE